jgi:hypothetical protein
LISGLAGKLVTSKIRSFISGSSDETLKQKSDLIENLVLSGTTQVSILNSMFAAIISAIVIGQKRIYPTIFALITIIAIFIVLILAILALDPDDLASKKFSFLPIKYSFGCKAVLVVVNLILCYVIWLSSSPEAHW